jgi:hypothetical protein
VGSGKCSLCSLEAKTYHETHSYLSLPYIPNNTVSGVISSSDFKFWGVNYFFMVNRIHTTPEGQTTFYQPLFTVSSVQGYNSQYLMDLDGFYCLWAIFLYFMC